MLLILDSTVLIAAMDTDRLHHTASRSRLENSETKALTTQTLRETLAVATRPLAANGLGMSVSAGLEALDGFRALCEDLLFEDAGWRAAYTEVVRTFQPAGRHLYDAGQVAHALARRHHGATLLTDDLKLLNRYGGVCPITLVVP